MTDKLVQIIGHLGAALMQESSSDDKIIMGHVRDACQLATNLRAELGDVFAQQTAGSGGAALRAEEAWSDLVEKDDRTSPEEYPEMCLITFDELRDYMRRATPITGALDPADSVYYEGYEQARSDLTALQPEAPAPVVEQEEWRQLARRIASEHDFWTTHPIVDQIVEAIGSAVASYRHCGQTGAQELREAMDLLHKARLDSIHHATDKVELRNLLAEMYEFVRGLNDFRPDSSLGRRVQTALRRQSTRNSPGANASEGSNG